MTLIVFQQPRLNLTRSQPYALTASSVSKLLPKSHSQHPRTDFAGLLHSRSANPVPASVCARGDFQGAGIRRGRRAPPRTHAQRRPAAPSGRRGTTPKARLTARLASNDAPCLAITPVRRPPTARNDCRTRPRAVAERALRRENCDTGGCGAEHRGNTHGARALQNQPSFDAPSQAAFSPHHSAAVALRVSPPARPPCRLANAIGPGRKGAAGFLTRAKTGTMRKWRTFR